MAEWDELCFVPGKNCTAGITYRYFLKSSRASVRYHIELNRNRCQFSDGSTMTTAEGSYWDVSTCFHCLCGDRQREVVGRTSHTFVLDGLAPLSPALSSWDPDLPCFFIWAMWLRIWTSPVDVHITQLDWHRQYWQVMGMWHNVKPKDEEAHDWVNLPWARPLQTQTMSTQMPSDKNTDRKNNNNKYTHTHTHKHTHMIMTIRSNLIPLTKKAVMAITLHSGEQCLVFWMRPTQMLKKVGWVENLILNAS